MNTRYEFLDAAKDNVMTNLYRPPNPHGAMPKRLEELRRSGQEILDDRYLREAESDNPAGTVGSLQRLGERAVVSLKAIPGKVAEVFKNLGKQRDIATQAYRTFQVSGRIERQALVPDLATTAMIVGIFLFIEGCVGAGLFVADGKADIPVAFIYGFSVAAINIATGMVTGFFPCRYLCFRLRNQHPESHDRLVRFTARGGLVALLGVMLILNFSAARVRATGSNKDIFDFDTVTLLATFDDYYAIALIVLGLLGGIVSVYKGRTGIKDPIPGYTEAWRDTKDAFSNAAQEIRDQYVDLVETVAENAIDPIADYSDALEEAIAGGPEAFAQDQAATAAHNKNVDAAILEYLQLIEDKRCERKYITREETIMPDPDVSALEALRVPSPEVSSDNGAPDRDVLSLTILELETARHEAIAAIEEIYTAFLVEVPAFHLSDKKGA